MKRRLLVLLLICSHAFGATWFVRSGASGNGTSWANAWANPRAINWSGLMLATLFVLRVEHIQGAPAVS